MLRLALAFTVLLAVARAVNVPPSFTCPKLPASPPATSIHNLRPADVSVVMALGDSITAAFALEGGAEEIRGKSWSMGGDDNVTVTITLPNLLKEYARVPLVGASTGKHIPTLCYGPVCPGYHHETDHFNMALSGAWISNLEHELNLLEKELDKHKINVTTDWKVMTILIGANDECISCLDLAEPFLNVKEYERNLRKIVTRLQEKFPRMFVNLVGMLHVSEVWALSQKSTHCKDVHRVLPEECMCAFKEGEKGDRHRKKMDELTDGYNTAMTTVAAEFNGKYDDFAVVVQPGFERANLTAFPVEFLSHLDCFHPSALAHEMMAAQLWNNMISPMKEKNDGKSPEIKIKCPTADTLIYTT